ncbi:hypothetical protein FBD94_09785 [Pedobacter hiemivivus]|uniref:DUF6965 domain-containing protein n=2 Tax=Pedobacter hiemivivus TaxID=2530454 RepID=A0A4V5PD03_9SPHI|nr:hypothetical protein [Pedobacter hiemivivus]TKC62496.1 hypothetical protein FBD94_09785 [Pedobacter hiemivivus]
MSDMTAEDWEAAFHGIELPETAQIDTGVFISNVPGFLEKSFAILHGGNERVAEPVRWRLQKLLDIANEANGVKE